MLALSKYQMRPSERTITPRTKYGQNDDRDADTLTETDEYEYTCNIHQDARVFRGNTYARIEKKQNFDESQRHSKSFRLTSSANQRLNQAEKLYNVNYGIYKKPPEEIDLAKYLTAQDSNEGLDAKDNSTQTDLLMWRAPEMYYTQPLGGKDAASQVIDAELFNFDREIEPLLDVLVRKTLDQAKDEVEKSWEIASIEKRTSQLLSMKANGDHARKQLELETINDKKTRIIFMNDKKLENESRWAVTRKVASVCMSKQCWPELFDQTCNSLFKLETWRNPTKIDIDDIFMPWLLESVGTYVDTSNISFELTDELCKNALRRHKVKFDLFIRQQQQNIAKKFIEQLTRNKISCIANYHSNEKLTKMRVWLDGAAFGLNDKRIGPIVITDDLTITDAEIAITDWLKSNEFDVETPEDGFLSSWYDLHEINKNVATLRDLKERKGTSFPDEIILENK